jgi:hypothetical protein
VRVTSRILCDGSTNPRDELDMRTTFSPGGAERSFRLDEFQARYCKHVDLYFLCRQHGHGRWKNVWWTDNRQPAGTHRVWLNSCSSWGSAEASHYQLSGWYKEGGPAGRRVWKQAAIRQVSADPEVYEFSDPSGGTARLQVNRR